MAVGAEDLISFREEAGSANHLFALTANEAVFVPDGLLVLHILITFKMKRQEKDSALPLGIIYN